MSQLVGCYQMGLRGGAFPLERPWLWEKEEKEKPFNPGQLRTGRKGMWWEYRGLVGKLPHHHQPRPCVN